MSDPTSPDAVSASGEPVADGIRRRSLRRIIAICFGVGVVLGVVIGVTVSVSSQSDDDVAKLSWTALEDGLEEARLTVPVDHSDPDGKTLELRIVRRPAADPAARIGSLLVNPGGPGFGAEVMVANTAGLLKPEILRHFDVVGMDPRGTGKSVPAIDCIDSADDLIATVDISPQDDTARQEQATVTNSFAKGCLERTGDAIAHMSTASTARDLDLLRRALGEDTISYFGVSYGCGLGATWATLFPETVRAAVLDGCEDPTADGFEAARQQATGFQRSVEAFLEKCESAGSECPIGKDRAPIEDLRELWVRAASGEVAGLPGRPALNEWMLQTAINVAMYSEDFWPIFAEAIASGLQGDGSILMQLADAYLQRRDDGTWGNEIEAFTVIGCMDDPTRPSAQETESLFAELSSIAPLVYPQGFFSAPVCEELPTPGDSPVTITGSGTPTLLVIGNTGDPATPFASTERMAAALESSVLVAVKSNDHGGYGINDCINDTVHRYLIDGVAPSAGTTC